MPVLSYVQARVIMQAIQDRKPKTRVTLDLGLSPAIIDINYKFREVRFQGSKMTFPDLEKIAHDEEVCYVVEKNRSPQKLKLFSADTNHLYALVPSNDAPTMEVAGVNMHRNDVKTPWQDVLDKISALAPLQGRVLDTCCGLGYASIALAKEADVTHVFTFERDSNVLELADFNPWSKDLYLNRKIRLTIGDVFRGIEMFGAAHFDAIMHDPPNEVQAPQLYSGEFYQQLYRVLRKGGRLCHCASTSDMKVLKRIAQNLKKVGFEVEIIDDIQGVLAEK